MNHDRHEAVLEAFARHLAVDPLAIEGDQRVEQDWGLEPLDLVLLAIRLEDELALEIPMEALVSVRTVADFEAVVLRAAHAGKDDRLGLGGPLRPSLEARIRRDVRRTRRSRVHCLTRRAMRTRAA